MLSENEMHRIALQGLVDIKGKDYVLKNKNNLYPCWSVNGDIAQISILLSDGKDDSVIDGKGNIEIDETEKAKEEYRFEINLNTGVCKHVQ